MLTFWHLALERGERLRPVSGVAAYSPAGTSCLFQFSFAFHDSWPQKDGERAVYGLKERNLAKIYIKMIPLGHKDPDAVRLLNWKKPTEKDVRTLSFPQLSRFSPHGVCYWEQKSSGDFPTVLYEVVSKRSSIIEGTLSVDDLNDTLDLLAQNMSKSSVSI